MILDTQPVRSTGNTVASGEWSKFETEDHTIYQLDTVYSQGGSTESVTLFIIPRDEGSAGPYTLPSLKEVMATYATSTDPGGPLPPSDQNVYSVTITAPQVDQEDIDSIASSIQFKSDPD